MSFLKSVEAARARLRENATPCDTRDIATNTPETVATSQLSQGGECPETTEPVAMSQVSQEGATADALASVATSQLSQQVADATSDPAADRLAALERMTEAFYMRAGYALAAAWSPTKAQADVIAFHDLADEWRHRSPPMPAGDIDRCARCTTATRCNPHLAKGGSIWSCAPCWPLFHAERDAQARAAIIRLMRQAQACGLLDDVDLDALEAAAPRETMSIGDTFDHDLREAGQ